MSAKNAETTFVTSAGFLLRCGDKYLIAHPSLDITRTQGWGIPKGRLDKGEEPYAGAIREFQEETNLDIANNSYGIKLHPVSKFTYTATIKKNYIKTYVIFFAETDDLSLLDFKFSCPSLLDDGRPEIAQYAWVSLEEALEKATKSQKPLFQFFINEQYKGSDQEAVQEVCTASTSETLQEG